MSENVDAIRQGAKQIMRDDRPVWVFGLAALLIIITVIAGAIAPGFGLLIMALSLFAGVIIEYVLWLQRVGGAGQGAS